YAAEAWKYPVQAGGKLLEEAARVSRKGAFASLEPRKRRKTVGDLAADQTKVATVDLTNPTLLETVRRVSERIKKEQRAPIPRAEPVSQKGMKMSTKINKIYELKPRARMTEGLRNTIKADVLDAYPALTQTDKDKLNKANSRQKEAHNDNESTESYTDDLIRNLVEKYAGQQESEVGRPTRNTENSGVLPESEGEDEGVLRQPIDEAPKKKRKATDKQKAHLAKTRELALQKRREYAQQRKAEKEQAEKEAYEKELAKRANQKLKEKVAKALSVREFDEITNTKKAPVLEQPKKGMKKKRVIIEEESSTEEEVEIVRIPKKAKTQKEPSPKKIKPKPTKSKAVPRQKRSPSPYRGGSMWDDYCLY
ncbi:hypothetical protein HDV00_012192, partial [Rhizophlyctis rosea]